MVEKLHQGSTVPFTQVANAILNSAELSLKEKGLLAYMLSKPAGWEFNVKSIAGEIKETKDTVASIINQLIEHGYIKREKILDGTKFAGYDYTVYQSPYPKFSDTENQDIPNIYLEINKEQQQEQESEDLHPSNTRQEDAPAAQVAPAMPEEPEELPALLIKLNEVARAHNTRPLTTDTEKKGAEYHAKTHGPDAIIEAWEDYLEDRPGRGFTLFLRDITDFSRYKPQQSTMSENIVTLFAGRKEVLRCPACGSDQGAYAGNYGCNACGRMYANGQTLREFYDEANKIPAERRLGEMIKQQKETVGLNPGTTTKGGGTGAGGSVTDPPAIPTLTDAGVDKHLAATA